MSILGMEEKSGGGNAVKHSTVTVSCPVCGADESCPLFWTKDYVFGCTADSFQVNRCAVCGCGYLSPRPAREDIPAYYPPEFYWSWEGERESLDWASVLSKRSRQLREKAKWLDDIGPGRLLDIGSQKGEFLWQMQQKGWIVEGVELDSSVPNPGGMPIRYGDFLSMDFDEGVYDAITFWAVLEHVYEPALFIQKASSLLKPGGRLVALVTNLESIQARFFQADDYPRHLTLFNRRSVDRLCSDAGLILQKTSTGQEIFGGSLSGGIVYAFKRLFGYSASESLREWKQIKDQDLFWCKWRNRNSALVKNISRLDRVLSWPLEKVLDKLGYGFIFTFCAHKRR